MIVVGVAAPALADDRARPPIRIQLGTCVDGEREAIERAVKVELGDDAKIDVNDGDNDPRTVLVRVDCAGDGVSAGVVIEVHQPDNPRHYRYALDWRDQPLDARPRLLGLAVAEAVDASRIELTAVPEPAPPARVVTHVIAPAPETSAWTLSIFGGQRSFHTDDGVGLLGLGLMPGRTISSHLRIAADVTAETSTVIAPSGVIAVTSVSSAPQISYRIGDRLHGELGAGVRVGVVRMIGEAIPGPILVGRRIVRAWFGPAATAAVGVDVTPRISVDASLELGMVAAGVTARDLGESAAAVSGGWTSVRVAVTLPL